MSLHRLRNHPARNGLLIGLLLLPLILYGIDNVSCIGQAGIGQIEGLDVVGPGCPALAGVTMWV